MLHRIYDLVFPVQAVIDICLHIRFYIVDAGAMAWPVDCFVTLQEQVEAIKVLGHIAIGRRNNAGCPAHNMVAGKNSVFLRQRKAQVIGCVSGRIYALDGPTVSFDEFTMLDSNIRLEIPVATCFNSDSLFQLPRTMWAVCIGPGIPECLQGFCCRRVIPVRMGDKNVGNFLVLESVF